MLELNHFVYAIVIKISQHRPFPNPLPFRLPGNRHPSIDSMEGHPVYGSLPEDSEVNDVSRWVVVVVCHVDGVVCLLCLGNTVDGKKSCTT